MSNETLFYVLGAVLVAGAVGISFLGIRAREFPPRPVLLGITAVFAVLVIGTATYAVLQAQDEQEHREAELAAEAEHAEEEEEPAGGASGGAGASGGGGGATTLEVTSPEDGSLEFSPDGLEAPAGAITLAYDNPSQVDHNIALELEGETIGETPTVAGRAVELTEELEPGEYVFFCSVPGHRESGMEGDLTVSGPEEP